MLPGDISRRSKKGMKQSSQHRCVSLKLVKRGASPSDPVVGEAPWSGGQCQVQSSEESGNAEGRTDVTGNRTLSLGGTQHQR